MILLKYFLAINQGIFYFSGIIKRKNLETEKNKYDLSCEIISLVLEEILNNIFEPIFLTPRHYGKIEPKGALSIIITFKPYTVGKEDTIKNEYVAYLKLKSGKIIDVHVSKRIKRLI